jgi:hypothetical protein
MIETLSIKDVLFIPLEAVSSEAGIAFVYKQDGGRVVKQEVATGAMNDNEVVIVQGLAEDDRILLSPPEGKEQLELVRLPGGATPPKAGGDTAIGPRPLPTGNGTAGNGAPKKP